MEEMTDYVHGHLKLFGREQDDTQSWKQLVADLPKDAIKDGQDCQSWQRVVTADSVSCSMAKVRPVAFGERLVSGVHSCQLFTVKTGKYNIIKITIIQFNRC